MLQLSGQFSLLRLDSFVTWYVLFFMRFWLSHIVYHWVSVIIVCDVRDWWIILDIEFRFCRVHLQLSQLHLLCVSVVWIQCINRLIWFYSWTLWCLWMFKLIHFLLTKRSLCCWKIRDVIFELLFLTSIPRRCIIAAFQASKWPRSLLFLSASAMTSI